MANRSRYDAWRMLLAAGIALAMAVITWSDAFAPWERDVHDVMARAAVDSVERSDRVSLILIDEATLDWGRDHYERGVLSGVGPERAHYLFPWNRAVYELIAAFLASGGAEVFALDVELAGPHPSGETAGDAGLGMTTGLQNTEGRPYVIHSLNFESTAAQQEELLVLDPTRRALLGSASVDVPGWSAAGVPFDRSDEGPYSNPILPYRTILGPLIEAGDPLLLGAVTAQPDPDAVIRRARLLVAWDDACFPSLGMAAALAYLESTEGDVQLSASRDTLTITTPIEQRHLPLTPSGDLHILWRDDGREDPADPAVGRFPTYPAHRVILSAFAAIGDPDSLPPDLPNGYLLEASEFEGRIVLLGSNATGLQDLKATPLREDYPGVKIHATVAESVLLNEGVRQLPTLLRVLSAVLVAVLVYLVTTGARLKVLKWALLAAVPTVLATTAWFAFRSTGLWLDVVGPSAGALVAYTVGTTFNHFTEGRRSREIAGLFQHFAPSEVVDRMIARPDDLLLAGETREITAFFSDIRGFTELSNSAALQADPGLLTRHLNAYLTEMTEAITNAGGTVDKYIGDAVVAIFGAPLDLKNHAAAACQAAIECQRRIRAFNERAASQGLPGFPTRIGLYSGPATLGCVGSRHRLSYTAIGSTVNMASRLEGVNKAYGTSILMGGPTRRLAGDGVQARLLDQIRVPGVTDAAPALEIHEVLEDVPDAPDESGVAAFEAARRLYERRQFEEAAEAFSALAARAGDLPAKVLRDRCRDYSHCPPGEDWDGAYRIQGK